MMLKLKRFVLQALLQMGESPMPEASLIDAVKLMARPEQPTTDDVLFALKADEASGFVTGASDELTGRSWLLTTKGTLKARQL